jgi:hypothetical protein
MLEDEKLSRYIEKHYKNGLKQCGVCQKWLDPAMFHKGRAYPDGLQGTCKSCKEVQANKQKYKRMSFDDLVKERERLYKQVDAISEVVIEKAK